MTAPEWLKPGLIGSGIGAVAVVIAGFSWGGWVTGGTADDMASSQARVQVVDALIPFCVARSQADPQVTQITAELDAAAAYKRPDILMKAGWATMPGAETADLDLAKACAATLANGS
jgi:hypothetical protein